MNKEYEILTRINELSVELEGIECLMTGIGNQLDNNLTDTLPTESLRMVLLSIRDYIGRIREDMCRI